MKYNIQVLIAHYTPRYISLYICATIFFLFSGNRRHFNQFSEARRMAKSGGKSTTTKWFDVTVLEEESTLSTGRLLLEKEKRWEDYTGRSYETEGDSTRFLSVKLQERKRKDIKKCLKTFDTAEV